MDIKPISETIIKCCDEWSRTLRVYTVEIDPSSCTIKSKISCRKLFVEDKTNIDRVEFPIIYCKGKAITYPRIMYYVGYDERRASIGKVEINNVTPCYGELTCVTDSEAEAAKLFGEYLAQRRKELIAECDEEKKKLDRRIEMLKKGN